MTPEKNIGALETQLFWARRKILEREVGPLALSLAFASATSDAPRTFAFMSGVIVLMWMSHRLKPYDRLYALWRDVGHPLTRAKNVWRQFPMFNVGWLAVGLVLAGVITKAGIVGL